MKALGIDSLKADPFRAVGFKYHNLHTLRLGGKPLNKLRTPVFVMSLASELEDKKVRAIRHALSHANGIPMESIGDLVIRTRGINADAWPAEIDVALDATRSLKEELDMRRPGHGEAVQARP